MEDSSLILKKSAKALAMKSILFSARAFFSPIDYTRTRELPTLLDCCDIFERKNLPLKVLDISSPQVLSMSLANHSSAWDITYINAFLPEIENMEKRKALLSTRNLNIQKADITDPDIHKQLRTYDLILSCSVFEHIVPEYGGDILASKNIGALLNEGGRFIFSVPYYKQGFHEYKNHNEYELHGNKDKSRYFFQRFYDKNTLQDQIIKPTGLSLDKVIHLGERFYFPNNINKRFSHLVSNKYALILLGRLFPMLSRIFMCRSEDPNRLKKPYLAIVSMEKKAKPS